MTQLKLSNDGSSYQSQLTDIPPLIFERLANVQQDMPSVGKGGIASMGGGSYKYRSADDVVNTAHPILAKHKVFITLQDVLDTHREERKTKSGTAQILTLIKAKYRFYTTDGSYIETIAFGEAADSGDKGAGKAMTYSYKYALCQVLNIPTADFKDPDADVTEFKAKDDEDFIGNPFEDEDNLANYVVNIPKSTRTHGKTLSEIGPAQLIESIRYWEDRAKSEKKPLTGAVLEFVSKAKQYIDVMAASAKL